MGSEVAKQRARIDAITKAITGPIERSDYLWIEGYCDNQNGCAVREFEIRVKDLDHTLFRMVSVAGIHCPVCQKLAKVHWVMTPDEYQAKSEEDARCSVTHQMRRRDHEQETGDRFLVETAAEICDDRLPPTPDGWFQDRPRVRGKSRTFVSERDKK